MISYSNGMRFALIPAQVIGVTGGRAPRSSELLAQLRQRAQQAASAGDDSAEEVRWLSLLEHACVALRSKWGLTHLGSDQRVPLSSVRTLNKASNYARTRLACL